MTLQYHECPDPYCKEGVLAKRGDCWCCDRCEAKVKDSRDYYRVMVGFLERGRKIEDAAAKCALAAMGRLHKIKKATDDADKSTLHLG